MQVSVEKTGDLERKLTVQVPGDSIDSRVSGRLDELRRQVRVKGFRPGRVPMNIIRQRYGEQVRDEILQEVMQTSLQEAIGEQKLRVAGVTRIEPKPQGDAEFEFTADLEVFPEVPQIEVADLALEKPQAEVADEDIDGMLTTLQEQRRNWTAVERAAADGDRVHLAFVAELGGERIPDVGQTELSPVLGQLSAFPELEELLRGSQAGQEKEAELNFPESWRQAALAGQKASVKLSIKAVEESELPEINDDFAAR